MPSALEFADVVRPLTPEQFISDRWGKKPFSTTLHPAVLERMLEGFHNGDVAHVLSECRRVDNSAYSAEEVEEMQRGLDGQRKTINQPYCFCPGALDLSRAFVESCGHMANDIEVGVYFSDVGGDAAQWHFDNNHNFTIQLSGQKEWYHIPSPPTDVTSGMFDTVRLPPIPESTNALPPRLLHAPLPILTPWQPRNLADVQRVPPPAGLAQSACFNLRPGSVIYLPPGHWHSVVPVEGGARHSDRPVADQSCL